MTDLTRRGAALALAAACLSASTSLVRADSLDAVRKAKRIRIAVAIGIPRFAFIDQNLQPTGSDVETAKLIAQDLGADLDLIQITNAARVPTIQTRKADILVASLAVTPERKKVIDFTVPYATLNIVVAGVPALAVKGYPDIVGKRIGVTRATVNDMLVTQNAKGAEIVRFEDDATLITAAVSGQVDLVSTQEAVVAVMNEKRADRPFETKFVQSELNLGIALPQGEDRLKDWLNDWVRSNMASGRLTALFRKFHGRDLPADLVTRT
ncbi:extracellular solute-binding protein family 3 [Methylobacterium sp. 4-46]|uniref:transporter substrate-binding domain-containing protein n=1 Tax=unclassified Methylobacterium TaxID=2615210 RepID=UPI000152C3A2|nr:MULTISPECIES: transporter substrate-binding domain-containing protein [Methylobacterium]ACA16198.1 extracellular solute-binding protein family 3 [Methylobacterium sp. 4-46]WFT81906.1 transporter substrate-binding domain-containing protein [Methylobacterium nodulans]